MPLYLHRLINHRHATLYILLAALLISLPSLGSGLFLDDYQQRTTLLQGSAGNVFDFFMPQSSTTLAHLESGVLPWWHWPETRISFFRPVAQWFMQLDYWLWPDEFVLMHLHSVLWYVALVAAVGAMYRKIMGHTWIASLSMLLFAIDSTHGGAVAWLANRNIFLCQLTGLLVLLAHMKHSAAWSLLGYCAFAISLCCGESALAITAFLFAYEVCLSKQPWPQRIRRLAPYALIGFVFIGYWKLGGYGTAGPGFYIDPAKEPMRFLSELPFRFTSYWVGWFTLPSAEILAAGIGHPSGKWAVLAFNISVLTGLGGLLWPVVQRQPLARFFLLGSLIATLPICASTVVGRATFYLGFGGSALIAMVSAYYFEQLRSQGISRLKLRAVKLLLMIHTVIAIPAFLINSTVQRFFDQWVDTQTVKLPTLGEENRHLLLLTSLSHIGNVTFPVIKDEALALGDNPRRQMPTFSSIRALVDGDGQFVLTRPSKYELLVEKLEGFSSMRTKPFGFKVGDQFEWSNFRVEVLTTNSRDEATRIKYQLSDELITAGKIMSWDKNQFVADTLPAVGESRIIQVKGPL